VSEKQSTDPSVVRFEPAFDMRTRLSRSLRRSIIERTQQSLTSRPTNASFFSDDRSQYGGEVLRQALPRSETNGHEDKALTRESEKMVPHSASTETAHRKYIQKNEINFAPVRLFPCPQPFAESAKIPDRLLYWTQSPGADATWRRKGDRLGQFNLKTSVPGGISPQVRQKFGQIIRHRTKRQNPNPQLGKGRDKNFEIHGVMPHPERIHERNRFYFIHQLFNQSGPCV
jgi:hypothetical protein